MKNSTFLRRGVAAVAATSALMALTVPSAHAVSTACGNAPNGYNVIESNDAKITGTNGPDFICAGNGANEINGRGSDDLIFGRGGNDRIIGGKGSDTINGGGGDDFIASGPEADIVNGNAGNDTIKGGAGSDDLNGGGGADIINGGKNGDVLSGGDGNDTLAGGGGGDNLKGGAGNDTVIGNKGRDTLDGGSGNDTMQGGSGNDFLTGAAGSDNLNGGNGSDSCILFDTAAACEATDQVSNIPQPPSPFDDDITTNEDTAVTFDVTANDIDPNGDALTVTSVTGSVVGSFTDNGDNTITYSPVGSFDSLPPGQKATELLSYDVTDGTSTVTAQVLITVKGRNDLPVALDEKITIDGTTPISVDVIANDSDIDGDSLSVSTASADGVDFAGGTFAMVGSTITWTPGAYVPVIGDKIFINYTTIDGRGGHDTAALELTIG